MKPIDDDDLLLHHYRDGLAPGRMAEIDAALASSPALRRRREALLDLLAAVDAAPASQPAPGFEARLWQRLAPQLDAPAPRFDVGAWLRRVFPPPAVLAVACMLLLAIGAGFYAGRSSAPAPDEVAQARADEAALRVLDAYVAAHLRATEGVLLTASNADDEELLEGNRELAASLVDSNRLYARAAARSGNTRLAGFLRQLEPLLISLANPPLSATIEGDDGLRDYLRSTDLLFQVRATRARLDRTGNRRT